MKKMFLLKSRYLLFALGFLLSVYTSAQVTVGGDTAPNAFSILEISTANVSGGLRLPHLSHAERETLSATQAFLDAKNRPGSAALGLTIYNTTTNCIEYWDGNKWVSLCLGTAEIGFNDEANNPVASDLTFPAEGSEQGPFVLVDAPNCTVENPPFAFALVTGGEYTSIDIIDASTGKFTVRMEPNPMAKERSAILRITNNCTGEYKEFIFSQAGDDLECGTTTATLEIQSYSGNELCRDGSITLYLKDYPTTGTFIWTLASKEVGRGNFLTVTEPGKYTVYGDKIGCTNKVEITITRGTTVAPAPVDFIVIGNNGIACGSGGEVELVVTSVAAGANIIWYKDGVKTTKTGRSIQAGKGRWFVVVENGTCNSLASKAVDVVENTDVASLDEPEMKVNDLVATPGSTLDLCRGGSMYLLVTNPDASATYTWYINNDAIGTGVSIYAPIPATDQFILRVRATGTGCAIEALVEANITSGVAPTAPFITTNTNDMLCGGVATLTAINSPTATSYRWYKDGVEHAVTTTSSLNVTATGSYTVIAIAGGCASVQSSARPIGASDFAELIWVSHPTTANVGETKTYSVSLNFPQVASYNWDVQGATLTNGQGTSSITVRFDVVGTATIECTAENACGNATGSPKAETVTVAANCTPAQITNTSDLNPNIKLNQNVTLSVTASGTGPLSYQWYRGTVGDISTPVISGSTLTVYSTTLGTMLYWCRVIATGTCTAPADSPQFTITVTQDPESIPIGSGAFSGKTCFDIALGNDNSNSCAALTSRAGQKTTFSNRTKQDPTTNSAAPYSGVQVYTFTPSGVVSNVRFDYVDGTGQVIESVTPEGTYSGNGISTPCKVKVDYKASLDNTLKGTTRQTGLKAELYVIYNNNANNSGNDMRLKLSLSFQDCACCGAKTTSGGWLTFMCHNLGADESLDPFTYVVGNTTGGGGTVGWLYQWGRQSDGHQLRTSPLQSGQSSTTTPNNNKFYVGGTLRSWYIPTVTTLWGDGTQNENVPKGVNDPCPAGWKVPSSKQWISIASGNPQASPNRPVGNNPNTFVWTGNGYKVGDALFLPVTGYRSGATGFILEPSAGIYWSSTMQNISSAGHLHIGQAYGYRTSYLDLISGVSVRCVAEN